MTLHLGSSHKQDSEIQTPLSERKGYKRKPLRIHMVSAFIILQPLASYVYSLYVVGIEDWYKPLTWLEYVDRINPTQWTLVSIAVISGCLISFVSRWTLLIATSGILGIFAFQMISQNRIVVSAVALPIILLATSFRLPYFQSELRWWKQLPRFLMPKNQIRIVMGLQPHRITLINLSQSGALLETSYKIRVPRIGERLLIDLEKDLSLGATVVRQNLSQVGVKFDQLTNKQKRELKLYLEKHKIPNQYAR